MRFIKNEYEEMFSCKVAGFPTRGGLLTVVTGDGKAFEIEDGNTPWEEAWEEIKKLMEESVDTGRNVLLEKYKDREYTLEPLNPDYDY